MPDATVVPVLGYDDVPAAAAWLCDAFGFRVRLRIADHRVQLVLGDGAVVVAGGARGDASSHSLLVRVDDVDAHHAQVEAAGAAIVSAPEDFPYGERQYTAEDVGGHRWTFSQTVSDADPADWGGTLVDAG
jgi:uncharacterized glyoxalase superfamily protein PhnB